LFSSVPADTAVAVAQGGGGAVVRLHEIG
jgi:hypothetical protein